MSEQEDLWRLQDLDRKLADLERRLTSLDRGERARSQLAQAEASLAGLEAELSALGQRHHDLEQESAANDQQLKARPSSALRERRGQLDEEILVLMERQEVLQAGRPALLEQLEEARGDLQMRLEEAVENEQLLLARRHEWQLARDSLATHSPWAATYEQLHKRWGEAVVGLKAGACMGCRMGLHDNGLRKVQQRQVVQCSTCGRFVALPSVDSH